MLFSERGTWYVVRGTSTDCKVFLKSLLWNLDGLGVFLVQKGMRFLDGLGGFPEKEEAEPQPSLICLFILPEC